MNGDDDQFDPDPAELTDADRQGAAQEAREAMDRLNNSNRVLVEARMLPRDKALTADQISEVREAFKAFCEATGATATQAGQQSGYKKAAISEWLAAKYKGDNDSVTHAINDWMEREARRQQARRPKDYVKTWVAEDIRTTVYSADKRGMMAAIVVPAGAGKTKVLKALTAELRGLYIYCEKNMTVRDLFRAIALTLGWRKETGTKGELRRFIVAKLIGSNRIIFLDEAHQLGQTIGDVRGIHDEARVPIVMAGTDEILRFINDRAHGRGQFSSRCIRYNALDYVHNAEGPDGDREGRDLFTIEEIRAFFAMKKIRLDSKALKFVWALACLPNYGTLRLVENTIEMVLDNEQGIELITRDHVLTALQQLVGVDCLYLERLAKKHAEISVEDTSERKVG